MKVQFTNTFDSSECFAVSSNLPSIVGSEAAAGVEERALFSAGFSDGSLRVWDFN